MSSLSHDRDDEFAALLAAYDVELATGIASVTNDQSTVREVGHELSHRLGKARQCLDMLERLWPRAKPDDGAMPATLGRFQIVRELGRGGFGIVYLARDEKLGRAIALKVQRPEAIISPELRRRFLREATTAARLRHPHIAAVHEVGQAGLRVWIASEYCEGRSLAAWLRDHRGTISPAAAAAFLVPLAGALEYSHREGVLHRDLKPSNVLLERRRPGGGETAEVLAAYTPKLIDFGLAKSVEGEEHLTRSGVLVGTPAYMAPEQAGGHASQLGPPTDVYALGAILFELLCGEPPFQGDNDLQTLRRIAEVEPPGPRRTRPDVPRDLEAICLKCLQKKPADRYRTAGELAADLDRFLAGRPTVARPLSGAARLLRWARRRPALAGLLAVSVAGSLAMVILALAYIAHLRESNATAERLQREATASAEQSKLQERAANRFLYAARMRVAHQALDHGATEQAAQILAAYDPHEPIANLRSFEWFYLKQRLHGERLTLRGHRGEVYTVAFAPNGRQLASGAADGSIKFWDPESGQELSSIAAHTSCVNSVVYSADGRLLYSGSCDHKIKIWDTSTHQLVAVLEGHSDLVSCLALSPRDGGLLATAGNGPEVRIWDLATGEIVQSFDTKMREIQSVAWRADGKRLVVAGAGSPNEKLDSEFISYDVDTGDTTQRPWGVLSIAASRTNDDVFVGMGDATIRRFGDDQQSGLLLGHVERVDSLALSPDGGVLASGGRESTIRIWDTATNVCTQILPGHSGRIQALAFSPRQPTLASASFDGTVKLWNYGNSNQDRLSSEMCVPQLLERRRQVALSSDFAYASVLGRHDQIEVYKIADGSLVGTLPQAALTYGFQFLADRPILFGLSLGSAGTVDEWDVSNWRLNRSHACPKGLEVARLGNYLLTQYSSGVTMSDVESSAAGNPSPALTKPVEVIAGEAATVWSPDGQTLALYRDRPGVIVMLSDFQSRRELGSGPLHAISNGGTYLVRKQDRTSAALVEGESGRELAVLRHNAGVLDAAFSPDNKTLATACDDGSVYLWNTATGEEMIRLRARHRDAFKVQFSADGRRLAVVSAVEIGNEQDLTYPNGDKIDSAKRFGVEISIWSGIDGP